MGKKLVLVCMDKRFNRYVDTTYKNDTDTIFLSSDGANAHNVIRSLSYAVENMGATDIEVVGHMDCAAMGIVTNALLGSMQDDELVEREVVRQFEGKQITDTRAKLAFHNSTRISESIIRYDARAHVEEHNPEIQERYIKHMFSDFVGLKVSSKVVDLKKVALDPNEPLSIVLTNATAASAMQICKEASTDFTSTYIIRTVEPRESIAPLKVVAHAIESFIDQNRISNMREIRIVDSPVPHTYLEIKADPFKDWSSRIYDILAKGQPQFLANWRISTFKSGVVSSEEVITRNGNEHAKVIARSQPRVKV